MSNQSPRGNNRYISYAVCLLLAGCTPKTGMVVPDAFSKYRSLEKVGRFHWGMPMAEVRQASSDLQPAGDKLILDTGEDPPFARSRVAFRFVEDKLAFMTYAAVCSGQEQVAECFDAFKEWKRSIEARYGQPSTKDFKAPSLDMIAHLQFKTIPNFGRAEHKVQWVTHETIIVLVHDGVAPTPTLSMTSASRVLMELLAREENPATGAAHTGRYTR